MITKCDNTWQFDPLLRFKCLAPTCIARISPWATWPDMDEAETRLGWLCLVGGFSTNPFWNIYVRQNWIICPKIRVKIKKSLSCQKASYSTLPETNKSLRKINGCFRWISFFGLPGKPSGLFFKAIVAGFRGKVAQKMTLGVLGSFSLQRLYFRECNSWTRMKGILGGFPCAPTTIWDDLGGLVSIICLGSWHLISWNGSWEKDGLPTSLIFDFQVRIKHSTNRPEGKGENSRHERYSKYYVCLGWLAWFVSSTFFEFLRVHIHHREVASSSSIFLSVGTLKYQKKSKRRT